MGKFIYLTGQRFGRWLVLSRAENNEYNQTMWLCRCDCGVEKVVLSPSLRSGKSKSCGCLANELISKRCKGIPLSEETKKKLSETNSNPSIEIRRKMSKNHADFSGKKNPMFGVHLCGKDASNYKHGLCGTKEYRKQQNRKYRARKYNAEGSHTIEDLKYIYDHQKGICGKCRKYIPFESMTVDHIVPLSWGGTNYPSNIQLLCLSCNSSKGNYHDIDYRDYVPLFLN